MAQSQRQTQRGQAIVLVALILVVLFGFLGLAIDGGRAYVDRRHMQASVDAAALAAAYNYMNNNDYTQAEQAATNQYAEDERLYAPPSCSGYGSTSVSCTFGDYTNQTLTLSVSDHSIAGVSFTATGRHRVPVAIMQLLGSGSTIPIGATATAVARQHGTNGAAIQTLSPGSCGGSGANSLTFQGNSTTTVTGDVWSNGSVFDNSNSNGGTVYGNVVGICPNAPFLSTPNNWTITGTQTNGFNIQDPDFPQPPLNGTPRTWNATSGSVELAGTYANDPSISGGHPCYFLAPGVYTFTSGFTDNAGFMSNELRPPDEPNMVTAGQPNITTLRADLSGTNVTSISVNTVPGAIPSGSSLYVGGQTFTSSSNTAAGATTIAINRQSVTGIIPNGSLLSVRALPQFWDSNGAGCGGSFSLTNPGSGSNNLSGTWSGVVTAVRWESTSGSSCSGPPATSSCYERESSPSMCKTVVLGPSGNIKVSVSSANSFTGVPGAQSFNVYLAQNGSCSGLAFAVNFSNGSNASTTINGGTLTGGWPTGAAAPPDGEGMPLAAGLPNADAAAGTPPRGDMGNERECVDQAVGGPADCPAWTPGAVAFYLPSTGCVDTHGGRADVYFFSGYQYSRVLLYEPGPEQSSSPNTCSNYINGNGFTSLLGIVYTPAASVTINGNTTYQATIAGGVIAWTATITGSGGVAITADPTLPTWPPAVTLTQ